MNIPNLITLLRLVSVPVIIWVILQNRMDYAFGLFVLSGISDAIDGPLARKCGTVSELGTILDPIADKALLVSIYVTLGIQGGLPSWIVLAAPFSSVPCSRTRHTLSPMIEAESGA